MAESESTSLLEAILGLKNREPFRPFRIVLSSGDKYVIENGQNLVEMRTELFYVSPKTDKFVFMRKNQLVAVEQAGNGRSTRRKA
jgi:hypothetical protein